MSLTFARQRQRDADQSVSPEGGEVGRARAVDAEVVRVDWAEQRIVGFRVESPAELERLVTSLGVCGRQLEAVGRHVAIGASAAVAAEAIHLAVNECVKPAFDGPHCAPTHWPLRPIVVTGGWAINHEAMAKWAMVNVLFILAPLILSGRREVFDTTGFSSISPVSPFSLSGLRRWQHSRYAD